MEPKESRAVNLFLTYCCTNLYALGIKGQGASGEGLPTAPLCPASPCLELRAVEQDSGGKVGC